MIDRLFSLSLGAPPTDGERVDMRSFVLQTKARPVLVEGKDVNLQAWSLVCQALFASIRFQTLD